MRTFKAVVNGNEHEVVVDEIKGQAGSTPKPAAKPQTPTPATPKPSAPPAGGARVRARWSLKCPAPSWISM